MSLSVAEGTGAHQEARGPSAIRGTVSAAAVLLALVGAAVISTSGANASVVRSCGTIPENTRHLAIDNVTTRGLRCTTARRDAVILFGCSSRTCRAGGRRFTCRNLGSGEAVDDRCVSGTVVVRFQTGV